MEDYTKKTMDHFHNPRNMGEIKDADGVGEVGNLRCGDVMKIYIKVGIRNKKPSFAEATAGRQETRNKQITNSKLSRRFGRDPDTFNNSINMSSGQIPNKSKIQNSNDKTETEEYIKDIKFKTLGCAAAIASSSMTTELARGKSLSDALKISRDDINKALGKLPAPKFHCSVLAAEGIKRAILDYRSRNN